MGLSPEECFEEITGIPAQSFYLSFLNYLDQILERALKENHWVALTAKTFSE